MENLIRRVFKQVLDVDLAGDGERFLVMPYKQAMADYGSDKPDLRVKLKLVEVTDIVANSEFKVFTSVKSIHNGKVVALRVPGAAAMPRSEIDGYTEYVKIYGAKGLAYIKINDVAAGREGMQGPVVKNLSDEVVAKLVEVTGAQSGDVIFFGADKAKIVYDSLGALRLKIGHSEFGKKNGLFEEGWRRCGSSTSRCSNTPKRKIVGWPATIRSPRPRTNAWICSKPIPKTATPRPTTWF